jgi:hypothetical protein
MPREKNQKPTIKITISTTPEVAAFLDKLLATGYYGNARAAVAERLLGDKVLELLRDKTLDSLTQGDHT